MTSPSRTDRPSDDERLLLGAALLSDASACASAWSTWSRRAPGDASGSCERLLPLVCRNLTRLGVRPEPRLKTAYARAVGSNGRLIGLAAEAVRVLAAAGIRTILLKGTALLLIHYGDMGARPMSDVDLLVPIADAEAAAEALRRSGWRGADPATWQRRGLHAGLLSRGSGETLDLHWHASYESRFAGADDAFWAGALPITVGGEPALALSPSDQLLLSVAHGLRFSVAPSSIWIADAVTILRGNGVDAERVALQCKERRLTFSVCRGLRLVRSVLRPEPSLDALIERLGRERPSWYERSEHACRVRSPAGLLGSLPNLWFAHRRAHGSGQKPGEGFFRFLARVWGLDGMRSLPLLLGRKAWRRLRSLSCRTGSG